MIYWHSLSDFLHMGGYGGYVWGSLGVMALAMAAEVIGLRRRQRLLLRQGTGERP